MSYGITGQKKETHTDAEGDLKARILNEIQTISNKIDRETVQKHVLRDVYELLRASSALLTEGAKECDSKSNRIETYYLTINVDQFS